MKLVFAFALTLACSSLPALAFEANAPLKDGIYEGEVQGSTEKCVAELKNAQAKFDHMINRVLVSTELKTNLTASDETVELECEYGVDEKNVCVGRTSRGEEITLRPDQSTLSLESSEGKVASCDLG